MRLTIHLTFAGQCEAAFTHYQRILGGSDLSLFKYRGTPMEAEVPADFCDKVVHGSLTVGGLVLMGADVAPAAYRAPQGVFVFVTCADATEAARVFEALADGGTIVLPLARTFWSPCFGALVDRFGVAWEITSAPAAT